MEARLKDKLNEFLTKLIHLESSFIRKELFLEEFKSDIQTLLEDLRRYLLSVDNVETVLQSLPDMGQFLGRLCSSQVVRGIPDLYKEVMCCVMALYQKDTVTPLESRAKAWSAAQLHSTVSMPDYYPSCTIGVSPSVVLAQNLSQITLKIHLTLEDQTTSGRKWNADFGYLPCDSEPLRHQLKELIDLIFCTPHFPEFHSVWEDVLTILSRFNTCDPIAISFYQRLTKILMENSGKSREVLSAKGCLILWTSYLPALEAEVLLLCETAAKHYLSSAIISMLHKSHLPAVCAMCPSVLLATSQMLHECVRQSRADTTLTRMMTVFFSCVQHQADRGQTTIQLLQPKSQSLSSLLKSFSKDAPTDDAAACLCRIGVYLNNIMNDKGELGCPNFIVYHYRLYLATLRISLLCHRKFLDGCLNVVAYLHHPMKIDLYIMMKSVLHKLVLALRSLLHKVNLEHTDLVYVITTASVESNTDKTMAIIGQFIMAFLYTALGGVNLFVKILPQVTHSEKSLDHLTCMMTSQEELGVDFTQWSPYKLKQYKDVVREVLCKSKSQSYRTKFYQEVTEAAEHFIQDEVT